jgi:uroporphyrinogen decarboxylase
MTSIERVKAALAFEEPDRVPLAHFAIDCDTIGRVIGRKTIVRDKAALQIAWWEGRRDEVVAQMTEDLIDFYRALDVWDIIPLWKMARVPPKGHHPDPPEKIADGEWRDDAGRVWRYSETTNEIVIVRDPNPPREWSEDDFPLDPGVGPEDESIYEVYDAVLPTLPEGAYILGPFPTATEQVLLGGYQQGMLEIAMHPELVERAVQSGIARARKQQEQWRPRGGHGVINGADFGHTTGTFVSPDTFRRLFAPAVEFNASAAHDAGLDFFQHSCGDFKPIIDQLADAGIDCMQSLQESAGMTPAVVKQLSGGRMAGWGGMDVGVLVGGSTDEVRATVRASIQRDRPGGGFIMGAGNSVAWGTPYDNFMAWLDEFEKLRDY